jgi:succinoglycan biosynthesis protein ExoM
MRTEISVCIATHRRPEGLERLLDSLVTQGSAPPFEVTVVDNDGARSAEPVAERFSDRLDLSYFVEPVRGLARVRNCAVRNSGSPFIAFIDDDEWAAPEWLAKMKRIADRTRADAVIGPVWQTFAPEVPDFIKQCGMFNKPARADGTDLPWYETRTGNALVRRSSLPDLRAPFAIRFDLIGGEDTDMFKRMLEGGARIVAAADADVFEYRPADRATLKWIMRRAMRNGGNIAELAGEHLRHSRLHRLTEAGQGATSHGAKVIRHWRMDRGEAMRHLILACEQIGRIFHIAGYSIEEYRHHS